MEIEGRKIVSVEPLSRSEMRWLGWTGRPPTALVLDDGTTLYVSCDEEGNHPGALFGKSKAGERFTVIVR